MLIDSIRQHALDAATANDWNAVAKTLSDPTIVVRDVTPVSYARLGAILGDDVRALVAGTIRNIAASLHPLAGEIGDAHVVLLNERAGLRIDSDERQGTIDEVAAVGNWPPELTAAIKAQGKQLESIAGRTVTADECKTAWRNQQSLDYLAAKVVDRTSSRAPVYAAQTRDDELLKSTRDRIAVAERDGVSLTITQADIDAALETI